ncbi:MAG: tyrosine--tRNA ligase [Planctomycetota bacterium]
MGNVFDTLKERGFIYQTTDDAGLLGLLGRDKVTFYIGYDPTATSLHAGNLLTIMAAAHMQRAGHKPIMIVGGGTGMVGDPSGKTEMRKMLTMDDIETNVAAIRAQLARYIDFGPGKALMLNNAAWLADLKYIEFLRDIGAHFSVNRMLAAESVQLRLEKGLSFIEFNYTLLQAYDFYVLMRDHGCTLQMGGQDQWGNIVAGTDLCRRMLNRQGYGITFPLVTDAQGRKFGKSVAGAVWLDAARLAPFEYYQFWRNAEDADVAKLLALFTFLPMEEVRRLGALTSPMLNRAKEILAFEATAITHGAAAAAEAYGAAVRQFGPADPKGEVATSSAITAVAGGDADVPVITLSRAELEQGYWVVKLVRDAGLAATNGEARRLIEQGGCYLGDTRVAAVDLSVTPALAPEGTLVVRSGKKKVRKVVFA